MSPQLLYFLLNTFPWVLIWAWFTYALLCIVFKDFRNGFSNFYIIEAIPNVFVTLGLLGTFTGIAYGLLKFDTSPDKIKDSIKGLLEGLKSAMFTTIVGIIWSLIFSKIIKIFLFSRKIEEPKSPELEALEALNANFREFKNTISTSQYNAIMDAFREVITNFNSVFEEFISDLVESNFHELKETIEQLAVWQEQHKDDVVALKDAYQSIVSQHQRFADTTERWVSKLDEISGQSSKLQKVIDEFNDAFNEDGNLSRILKDVSSAAVELKIVTDNFSSLSSKMSETTDSIKLTADGVTLWTRQVEGVKDSVASIVNKVDQMQSLDVNKLNSSLNAMLATMDTLFLEYINSIEKKINEINAANAKEKK